MARQGMPRVGILDSGWMATVEGLFLGQGVLMNTYRWSPSPVFDKAYDEAARITPKPGDHYRLVPVGWGMGVFHLESLSLVFAHREKVEVSQWLRDHGIKLDVNGVRQETRRREKQMKELIEENERLKVEVLGKRDDDE